MFFADFPKICEMENLGSHLAMWTDDRFLPQSKQIFRKVHSAKIISLITSGRLL